MIEFNGELTFKNEALKVGKQTFSFSIYFNCGIGGDLNFGEEIRLGASYILGAGVIIEVYEE